MIDLHTHSTASDGTLSPCELVNYAAEKNIGVLALTDHDTIEGLAEATVAAKNAKIQFIPGIELHIAWPTGEFHLLGLGIKSISQELVKIIDLLQKGRKKRNLEIISRMQEAGIDIKITDIKTTNAKTIGRPHIATWMVEQKIVKNHQHAFDRYLAKGRPFFVERKGASLDESIGAITQSGGVPVLAHPLSLYVSWGKMEGVLQNLYERGIQGLEAWHPAARVVECERLEKLARHIGFFITAGSDFHGKTIRPDRAIGKTAGGKTIDDIFWTEELKPALEK
ncbi:MAG TPA: PHP domain-containing protein [Treponemataceae bacterium]|nr:PHP domain-containing protein [Treponemataceae bacterium]